MTRRKRISGYDIIGDVHGHVDALLVLLEKLGYCKDESGSFSHATDRQAIFVGDLINRGPAVRETLRIVCKMVEEKSALAILGNHEFNLLGMETEGDDGTPLRAHSPKNLTQCAKTRDAFRDSPEDWRDCLAWIRKLPLSLELTGLKVVHAAWHPPSLKVIAGRTFEDENFLRAAFNPEQPEANAVGITLKGIKIPLPKGRKIP